MATQNLVSLQPIIFFVNRKRLRLDLARANTDPRRADGRLNLLERLICYSFLGYLQQILYHIFYFIIYFKLVFTNSIKQYHLSFGSYILRRLLKTVLNKLIFRETKIVSFLLDFRFDRVAHCIRLKRLVGFKTSQLQALWWAGEALSPPPVRRPALWIGNGCHFCVAQKLSELEQRCVMHARWLKDKCHCMREKNVYRVRTVYSAIVSRIQIHGHCTPIHQDHNKLQLVLRTLLSMHVRPCASISCVLLSLFGLVA